MLVLADGYPSQPTAIGNDVLAAAARKSLRLYVEYPESLPGLELAKPRAAGWERVVVASDGFGRPLPRLQILAAHGCRFVPVKAAAPDLVLARVAGFDRAAFGLPDETFPLLFAAKLPAGNPPVLVATTKLSQMVTGRYAPAGDWRLVWQMILNRVAPGAVPDLPAWVPSVRPAFGPGDDLPADVEAVALRRGLDWFRKSRLLVHPSRSEELRRETAHGELIAAPPSGAPVGDGTLGILEGYSSEIAPDGSQRQRLLLRSDCISETGMAFAVAGRALGDAGAAAIGANLQDYLYTKSGAVGGQRGDPKHGSYGLVAWGVSNPAWMVANYGDDNARVLLGTFAAAAATKADRWDELLMRSLLGNLRTTGPTGFRPNRVDQGPLGAGWEAYFRNATPSYQPHYQAYLWACYLAAYQVTGDRLFLDRARTAIGLTMRAYPDRWRWTYTIQSERARMLLPLAWLVRVDDTPEHRGWLKAVADDLLAHQDAGGAIAERLGAAGRGDYPPPGSNAAFGTNEAPLIQADGDPATDLLYTLNFAFLGLHEAAAATGDARYRRAEDALARYLCRVQVRSDRHPELDGAWFRAFDFRRWEYWASSGDHGWGAWSVETGWTQAWVVTVLALRQQQKSLWDLAAASGAGRHHAALRKQMLPEDVVKSGGLKREAHAAVGKPVACTRPDARYPGRGPETLTDGLLAPAAHTDAQWLGYEGADFEATVDLGRAVPVTGVALDTLRNGPLAIRTPRRVEFLASDDGKTFRSLATVQPDEGKKAGVVRVEAAALTETARYVRVRVAARPADAAGVKSWLFVGEFLVNPPARGATK